MNRRQWVAMGLGLVLVVLTLVFPYTRYDPFDPSSVYPSQTKGEAGVIESTSFVLMDLFADPKDGFRPIWLTPDPLGIDRPLKSNGLLSLGVYWSVVAWTVLGFAVLTISAVAWLGGREWRRSAVDRMRRALIPRRVRPRFSIRGLMVAVVLAALAVKLAQFPRWLEYHRKAVAYSNPVIRWPGSSGSPEGEARVKRVNEWADAMKEKYERAARHPWLSVEPDLPMP